MEKQNKCYTEVMSIKTNNNKTHSNELVRDQSSSNMIHSLQHHLKYCYHWKHWW